MVVRVLIVVMVSLSLTVPAVGASGQVLPPWLYLHQDGSMNDVEPAGNSTAFTFSVVGPHQVNFTSNKTGQAIDVRNGVEAVLWFSTNYAISTQITARLEAGGKVWRAAEEVVVNTDREPVSFIFAGPRTTIPAGTTLSFTLELHGIGDRVADMPVEPFTWQVAFLYDGAEVPSGIHIRQPSSPDSQNGEGGLDVDGGAANARRPGVIAYFALGVAAIATTSIALATRRWET